MFISITRLLMLMFFCLVLTGCGGDHVLPSEQTPDPVVVDVPIALIKRSMPVDENGALIAQDLRRLNDFVPGATLYIKARASASAPEINITDRAFFSAEQIAAATADNPLPAYDVKDLEVSYDGNTLIFAMRAPTIAGADDDEQPSWNLWTYDLPTDSLQRIIRDDALAEAGQDTAPVFLPDGRIVFSSTRQQNNQAILLDENKPQYQAVDEDRRQIASVLHVIHADGSNIRQISFNQSHDRDPIVLSSGKILFSRWDNAVNNNNFNLYQMNADGSELELMYGHHSHASERSADSLHYAQMRELPDGRIVSALSPLESDQWGGEFVAIDIQQFIDRTQPISGQGGNAEQAALFDNITIDGELSPGGRFAAVYPLWDGSQRMLFSWSQCRVYAPGDSPDASRRIVPCSAEWLATEGIEAAPLLYGVWMYEPASNTQLVVAVPQENRLYSEVVAMQARAFPADSQQSATFSPQLATENLAQVHIRSVYDVAGQDISPQGITLLADPVQTAVEQRPARFLRIVKAVSLPTDEERDFANSAFGRSGAQLMREIIGYTPIEPDGSALFTVPANVPLAFSVVDGAGKRISERHQNWLQFAPGEQRSCNGCHTQASTAAHGRADAEAATINQGAANMGVPFPNTHPDLFADLGETMAQTAGRINGIHYPSADIKFNDIWTNPALQSPAASYTLAYGDMQSAIPITPACATNWTALCRIQIHYPLHIQPLFELSRQVLAQDGVDVVQDHRCVNCHTPENAAGQAQVPAAQLDLRGTDSSDDPAHLTSYRELMFVDNEQEVVQGLLSDRQVPVTDANGAPVFETDEDGNMILDDLGQAIPVLRTVQINPAMSVTGARASQRFFQPFAAANSHYGWLSPAELKLIAEWLDIGGQYYNDPFVAPLN